MIKFDIKHRMTGEVKFTAEIDCDESADISIKLGLAVMWGIKNGLDLSWANLVRANLSWANLSWANLEGANLSWANLVRANLEGANLVRANLEGANLVRANLSWANLVRANLEGANLIVGGQRSDGYRFLLIRDNDGVGFTLRAGCRSFRSFDDARTHWATTRKGTMLGDESAALVDHLERMALAVKWIEPAVVATSRPRAKASRAKVKKPAVRKTKKRAA